MNSEEVISYWMESSDDDAGTMKHLIRARYDDYKREFKAKCTREYTTRMVKSIEELRSWIKTKL